MWLNFLRNRPSHWTIWHIDMSRKRCNDRCSVNICTFNRYMMTGEFLSHRPVTKGFDVFVDLCLKKRWINCRDGGDWHAIALIITSLKCLKCSHDRSPLRSRNIVRAVSCKWTPFHRRHFQAHFLEWKYLNSDKNFTKVCSYGLK